MTEENQRIITDFKASFLLDGFNDTQKAYMENVINFWSIKLKEKDDQAVVAVEIVGNNMNRFFLKVLAELKEPKPMCCCEHAYNDALTEAKKKLTD